MQHSNDERNPLLDSGLHANRSADLRPHPVALGAAHWVCAEHKGCDKGCAPTERGAQYDGSWYVFGTIAEAVRFKRAEDSPSVRVRLEVIALSGAHRFG